MDLWAFDREKDISPRRHEVHEEKISADFDQVEPPLASWSGRRPAQGHAWPDHLSRHRVDADGPVKPDHDGFGSRADSTRLETALVPQRMLLRELRAFVVRFFLS